MIALADVEIVKGKKFNYINIPISYDIETSSFYNEEHEKVAIPYTHCFAIKDKTYLFRETEQAVDFIKEMARNFDCDFFGKNKLIIYVHNLSYEFGFIRKYFKWGNVFANGSERKILFASLLEYNVEFRCSCMLSGKSLEDLSEDLEHKKMVGDLDYSLLRTPLTVLNEKELGYIYEDVLVVNEYIQTQIDEYGSVNDTPYTNTGRVRRYVRNHTRKSKEYTNLLRRLTMGADEYRALRSAFAGGYVHANAIHNGKVLDNVHSFDFTSSYPARMLEMKFPMSKGRSINIYSEEDMDIISNSFCVLTLIELKGVTCDVPCPYISSSKPIESSGVIDDNGRIVEAASLKMWVTDVDYKIIKQVYDYDEISFGGTWVYEADYLPKEFLECLLKLYADKTILKGVKGSERLYQLAKGMLNALYGMCVTDIIRDEYELIKNEVKKIVYDTNEEAEIRFLELLEKENKSKKRFLFYPWGVWITAYSRSLLFETMLKLGNDFVYTDTDSLKFINFDVHKDLFTEASESIKNRLKDVAAHYNFDWNLFEPADIKGNKHLIGEWDYEGVYDRFKTLGCKRYMFEKNGEISITVSGLSKNKPLDYIKSQADPFELFSDGMVIPKEHSGKLCHYYVDEEREGCVKDYNGVEYNYKQLSAVHMENISFNMKIGANYKEFLYEIQEWR